MVRAFKSILKITRKKLMKFECINDFICFVHLCQYKFINFFLEFLNFILLKIQSKYSKRIFMILLITSVYLSAGVGFTVIILTVFFIFSLLEDLYDFLYSEFKYFYSFWSKNAELILFTFNYLLLLFFLFFFLFFSYSYCYNYTHSLPVIECAGEYKFAFEKIFIKPSARDMYRKAKLLTLQHKIFVVYKFTPQRVFYLPLTTHPQGKLNEDHVKIGSSTILENIAGKDQFLSLQAHENFNKDHVTFTPVDKSTLLGYDSSTAKKLSSIIEDTTKKKIIDVGELVDGGSSIDIDF